MECALCAGGGLCGYWCGDAVRCLCVCVRERERDRGWHIVFFCGGMGDSKMDGG